MNSEARLTIVKGPVLTEAELIEQLINLESLDESLGAEVSKTAVSLVEHIRSDYTPSLMEQFLRAYPLDSDAGISLMMLAEAYLRIPDSYTRDALIKDKLAAKDWRLTGPERSPLMKLVSLGLQLTSRMLKSSTLSSVVAFPLRHGVQIAMRIMGKQFVLGESIEAALSRAQKLEAKGYTYSYDMLGEGARTAADAKRYYKAYEDAIKALAKRAETDDLRVNPGISVKLSALCARYELLQADRAREQLQQQMLKLCELAAELRVGLNIDAEECARLELSLDIIQTLIEAPGLAGWDGLGIVVQAYNKRAYEVIKTLHGWAEQSDRNIMVRLVKGAYWDAEIKLAQVQGLSDFPVFTAKSNTDISYLACAKLLIRLADRIYPQFATHNAYSADCIAHWASQAGIKYEFQRLHGMGESLHTQIKSRFGNPCRIYAPVGTHKDLLAYLVRRLLENGANSSFVSQLADPAIPAQRVVPNPLTQKTSVQLPTGVEIFGERVNSRGFDLGERSDLAVLDSLRSPYITHLWGDKGDIEVTSPFNHQPVGSYQSSAESEIDLMMEQADKALPDWSQRSDRGQLLNAVADIYEQNTGEFLALLAREAGKTLADAVNELREAVDFLRYYAQQSETLDSSTEARGVIACISPWNFPLAIFTGQVAAALAAGNCVLAKPAEQTSLIARLAIELFYKAGIPEQVVQLVLGYGRTQGAYLVSRPQLKGVLFTGSTQTAKLIDKTLAENASPDAILIAETGGLNAMIADSSALPEQIVTDVVASAFQSAGQRCSALRMLYVQREIYQDVCDMLVGAMDLLVAGDPLKLSTDVGPLIDAAAHTQLKQYVDSKARDVVNQTPVDIESGYFLAPTLIKVQGIEDLDEERFGPILHIAPYDAENLQTIVSTINSRGYGLTFGCHTRVRERAEYLARELNVGNIYINRNQIGAVVESQPFGGEGLSGTGPKAGGPQYIQALRRAAVRPAQAATVEEEDIISEALLVAAWRDFRRTVKTTESISQTECPGVTGESNTLIVNPRGSWLCAGDDTAWEMAIDAATAGNPVMLVTNASEPEGLDSSLPIKRIKGNLNLAHLRHLSHLSGVSLSGSEDWCRLARRILSQRQGVIVPLLIEPGISPRHVCEKHLCEDTTAAGGNPQLFMQ